MDKKLKIWADIDNAPHVLVLYPIIRRLQSLSHEVLVTARDYGQVVPLLRLYDLHFRLIGKHAGKSKIKKVLFFFLRSARLLLYAAGKKFDLVFSHGTRGIFIPARLLKIPVVVLTDFEYGYLPVFMGNWASMVIVPEVVQNSIIKKNESNPHKYRHYPGLKEELYVYDSQHKLDILRVLNIPSSKVVVLVRPPATMAHYHIRKSEELFFRILNYLVLQDCVHLILIPRTPQQKKEVMDYLRRRSAVNVTIPTQVFRGPELIRSVDIVISGGGTMNREAACLGVPVYSIYAGTLGAVDRHLLKTGKLKVVRNLDELATIPFLKRTETRRVEKTGIRDKLIDVIVGELCSAAEKAKVCSYGRTSIQRGVQ